MRIAGEEWGRSRGKGYEWTERWVNVDSMRRVGPVLPEEVFVYVRGEKGVALVYYPEGVPENPARFVTGFTLKESREFVPEFIRALKKLGWGEEFYDWLSEHDTYELFEGEEW